MDDIRQDDHRLRRTAAVITPPAKDYMSTGQADAVITLLDKAQVHNEAMVIYADNQLAKLQAARQTYAATDDEAAQRLRGIDEADQ